MVWVWISFTLNNLGLNSKFVQRGKRELCPNHEEGLKQIFHDTITGFSRYCNTVASTEAIEATIASVECAVTSVGPPLSCAFVLRLPPETFLHR